MNRIILEDIPFDVDSEGLASLLRVNTGSKQYPEFLAILDEARLVARPRAAFAVTSAAVAGDDSVDIGGVRFTSLILKVNLEKAGAVFPFIATCGKEIEEWAGSMKGMLRTYWADSIMLMALGCAVGLMENYIKERINAPLSFMNPGSLDDWPIQQQEGLFTLLGDIPGTIGVELTEHMVIRPLKSVSGISFASEEGFVNCALCPKDRCPSRRAAYDSNLYTARYGKD